MSLIYKKKFIVLFLLSIALLVNFRKIETYLIVRSCPIPKQAGNDKFYSQSFEDYILSMVFADIDKGTYIDIGANNPMSGNVTRFFYEKGWTGINIEPIKRWYEVLLKERSRDVNLNIGVSNKEGELEFFHIENAEVLSTFNPKVAATHAKQNMPSTSYRVQVQSLNQILSDHPLKEINFVKIDVEGVEKEVLEGIDFKKHRPQVFLLEATEPNSREPSHQPWEPILLANDYEFVFFDGLNRYYLAKEHHKDLIKNYKRAAECALAIKRYYKVFRGFYEMIYNKDL
jgi:FkbM family methyltransferase